jgi:triacylglycerol lipase
MNECVQSVDYRAVIPMRGLPPILGSARPPIWREARVGLEAAALLRDPIFRGRGVTDGRGDPVLLIPGFLAGDGSLVLMSDWLRRCGYRPSRAGMVVNVDCSGAAIVHLERRLERLAAEAGRRVAIVGQSRGGALAKVLAMRRPELVAGIVTLGSPQLEPLAVHPLVRLELAAVSTLGSLGAPGLFKRACLEAECCASFWEDLAGEFPRGVNAVAVYSRTDGIVDWRACLDPSAEHVEVRASHIGMAVNAAAWRAVAGALESFGEAAGPRKRAAGGEGRRVRSAA